MGKSNYFRVAFDESKMTDFVNLAEVPVMTYDPMTDSHIALLLQKTPVNRSAIIRRLLKKMPRDTQPKDVLAVMEQLGQPCTGGLVQQVRYNHQLRVVKAEEGSTIPPSAITEEEANRVKRRSSGKLMRIPGVHSITVEPFGDDHGLFVYVEDVDVAKKLPTHLVGYEYTVRVGKRPTTQPVQYTADALREVRALAKKLGGLDALRQAVEILSD